MHLRFQHLLDKIDLKKKKKYPSYYKMSFF